MPRRPRRLAPSSSASSFFRSGDKIFNVPTDVADAHAMALADEVVREKCRPRVLFEVVTNMPLLCTAISFRAARHLLRAMLTCDSPPRGFSDMQPLYCVAAAMEAVTASVAAADDFYVAKIKHILCKVVRESKDTLTVGTVLECTFQYKLLFAALSYVPRLCSAWAQEQTYRLLHAELGVNGCVLSRTCLYQCLSLYMDVTKTWGEELRLCRARSVLQWLSFTSFIDSGRAGYYGHLQAGSLCVLHLMNDIPGEAFDWAKSFVRHATDTIDFTERSDRDEVMRMCYRMSAIRSDAGGRGDALLAHLMVGVPIARPSPLLVARWVRGMLHGREEHRRLLCAHMPNATLRHAWSEDGVLDMAMFAVVRDLGDVDVWNAFGNGSSRLEQARKLVNPTPKEVRKMADDAGRSYFDACGRAAEAKCAKEAAKAAFEVLTEWPCIAFTPLHAMKSAVLERLEEVESHPRCPITHEPILVPAHVGVHVFERDAILKWAGEHGTNPMTRETLWVYDVQVRPHDA